MARSIHNSRSQLFPFDNSGHGLPIDEADKFNGALMQFINM